MKELGADGGYHDTQFFVQLATEGVGVGFAELYFAARKLPKPTMPLVRGALADEVSVVAGNHRGDHTLRRVLLFCRQAIRPMM